MPLELPGPDETRLSHSPLVLSLAQIRLGEPAPLSEGKNALAIHQGLGGRTGGYPKLERSVTQAIAVQMVENAVQPAVMPPQQGWRMSSADGAWTVHLMADVITLETTAYSTWEGDFRDRFLRLLSIVHHHVPLSLEQRLGLRYVNRITEPPIKHPHEWREYIVPELLGPALDERLRSAIRATQQQIDLDVGNGASCNMRHGFFFDAERGNVPTYLLDYDIYREGLRPFDLNEVMETIDGFHRLVLQLFQASITQQMYDFLRSGND